MTINELKIACYLYERFTNYDTGYKALRTIKVIDLTQSDHVVKLLNWLRSWGCRQFKVDNTDMSIRKIMEWYSLCSKHLPHFNLGLLQGERMNFEVTISIFNRLQNTKIAERFNSTSDVTVGPVGAAKILFALRPNFYSPWDRPICECKDYSLDGSGYVKYLEDIKGSLFELEKQCHENGCNLSDLPRLTKRLDSPLPKLIDEYNWVTITNNCDPGEIIQLIE